MREDTAESRWKDAGLLGSLVCQGPKAMPTDNGCCAPELMPLACPDKLFRLKSPRKVSRVKEQQGLFCSLHSSVISPTTRHHTGTPPNLALPVKLNKEIMFTAKGFSQQDGLSRFRSSRGLVWVTRLLTCIQSPELPYCKVHPWH